MAKKITKSKKTRSAKTVSRKSLKNNLLINIRKYSIIWLPLLLISVSLVALNGGQVKNAAVLGASSVNYYTSANITWQSIPGATAYNIYYKKISDPSFIHAVRSIPSNSTSYTINFLKRKTYYQYYVTALNSSGREFWTSSTNTLIVQ